MAEIKTKSMKNLKFIHYGAYVVIGLTGLYFIYLNIKKRKK